MKKLVVILDGVRETRLTLEEAEWLLREICLGKLPRLQEPEKLKRDLAAAIEKMREP